MTSLFPASRKSGDEPFVTFYDHATGERTELSVATFDNWVAKSANLLVEEFDVAPHDRAALLLGPHWTTAVLLFACWRVGAAAVPAHPATPADALAGLLDSAGAAVAVVEETSMEAAAALDNHPPLLAVGAGMAGRLTRPAPPDVLGFGEEAPGFGDDYDGPAGDDDIEALRFADVAADAPRALRLSRRMLLAAAEAASELRAGDRLLTTRPPHSVDGVVLGLLAPWLRQASVVVVRNPSPAKLEHTIRSERVTAVLADAGIFKAMAGPPNAPTLRQVLVARS